MASIENTSSSKLLAQDVSPAGASRAAVDVGGTFTDLIAVIDGRLLALKVPSVPGSPDKAVLEALRMTDAAGAPLVHGSTVATNAVLERKGARTAFVATEGFADIIEIGRQERPHLYRLQVEKPAPLIARSLRFEVAERVGPGGRVIKRLTRAEARRVARQCRQAGVEAVAVCLLFSYEEAAHEEMLREELERQGLHVSISSFLLPEYREYERASTTVINAYVSPVMEDYLGRLERSLGEAAPSLRLMHSAGGTSSASSSRSRAADLVLSGPAGGAVATRWLAASSGIGEAIGFDMGGTSTDVSLVSGGELAVTREKRIGGLPVSLPMIDIETIGAGGGSIAYIDRAGALKVGPRSAGADPGPACYGSSMLPTVTDANMVLGRLEPSWFAGGMMPLYPRRSTEAFAGLRRGVGAVAAARAALDIALSHMEAALKHASLERGHDPREFALVAFGGAGPLHACELADRLEIPRVLVPVYPGLFSSMGMLLADPGRDYTRTVMARLEGAGDLLSSVFGSLRKQATAEMRVEGFAAWRLRFRRSLSVRYAGQSHEIEIAVSSLARGNVVRHFEQAYLAAYGYLRDPSEIEVVNVRLGCRASHEEIPVTPVENRRGPIEPLTSRAVHFAKNKATAHVFARRDIGAGRSVTGPAIIVQEDTTTVVPPGWRAAHDIMGSLELEVAR